MDSLARERGGWSPPRLIRARVGRWMAGCKKIPLAGWLAIVMVGGWANVLVTAGCAPVLPERNKPGGAARWAQALATDAVVRWAEDALLCRVVGNGVGNEGWLPDRGGTWVLTYRSAKRGKALDVSVDTDGNVKTADVPDSVAARLRPLPADWDDSPRAWAATSAHQQGVPLNTFEAVLAYDAAPELQPGELVWRIRFFLQGGGFETHVVSAHSKYLGRVLAVTNGP